MKNLLLLLVILFVAVYFLRPEWLDVFHFQSAPPAVVTTPPGAAGTHAQHARNFDAVSAELQQDMANIPSALDGAGQPPAHAFDVKRKVHPYLSSHEEYQVLTRVCDLIIQADAERNSLQQSYKAQQARATFHSSLDSVDKKHPSPPPPPPEADVAAARQRAAGTWGDYRTKTSTEVARLLGTLKGKTL